ncbi:MAG TPA: hypothetical protein VFX16_08555 [Pseudonocardiaceae bacterium]|nr:hypothetical protein [Pseudonocardiaceae bacterium]
MTDIDTLVNGNAAACRQAADWLGRAAAGVDANGSAIGKAQATSESCWQGSAADGFRDHIGNLGTDADQLSASALTVRQALDAFAADLDTVNARIAQARSVASAAGLTLTPTTIEAPGPGPGRVYGPIPAQEAIEFYQAQAMYNGKLTAFREARTTVTEARQLESEAHTQLTGPMRDSTNRVRSLATIGSGLTGAGLTVVQEVQGAANELYDAADNIAQHAQRMQQLAVDSELTDAGRAAAARAGQLASAGAQETAAEAARMEKAVDKVPESVRDLIAKNPGALLEDSSGLLKLGKGALKGIPYVGTGAALLFGGIEVADGSETPGQAVAETGMSLAGGIAGGMAGMEVGSIVGSVVPIVGTTAGGVIGTIAGSIIGSLSGGKAGDQLTGVR